MMSAVLTSVIPASALVNDFFHFFSLKLTFEIFHSVKTNSGYLDWCLFSNFENELQLSVVIMLSNVWIYLFYKFLPRF